jgi:hypothetical protein
MAKYAWQKLEEHFRQNLESILSFLGMSKTKLRKKSHSNSYIQAIGTRALQKKLAKSDATRPTQTLVTAVEIADALEVPLVKLLLPGPDFQRFLNDNWISLTDGQNLQARSPGKDFVYDFRATNATEGRRFYLEVLGERQLKTFDLGAEIGEDVLSRLPFVRGCSLFVNSAIAKSFGVASIREQIELLHHEMQPGWQARLNGGAPKIRNAISERHFENLFFGFLGSLPQSARHLAKMWPEEREKWLLELRKFVASGNYLPLIVPLREVVPASHRYLLKWRTVATVESLLIRQAEKPELDIHCRLSADQTFEYRRALNDVWCNSLKYLQRKFGGTNPMDISLRQLDDYIERGRSAPSPDEWRRERQRNKRKP